MGRSGGIGGLVGKAQAKAAGGKKKKKVSAIESFLTQFRNRQQQPQRLPIPTRNLAAPAGGARPSRRGNWGGLFGMGR